MPLWFQILVGVVGLGVVKEILGLFTKLPNLWQWGISIVTYSTLIIASDFYFAPPSARYLTQSQENILVKELSTVRGIKLIHLASLPSDREANDYANALTRVFIKSGIEIVLGRPFEGGNFVHKGFNVPPLPPEYWLYQPEITLFHTQLLSVEPSGKTRPMPVNAIQIAKAFEQACIKVSFATDFRLADNEYTFFVGTNRNKGISSHIPCSILRLLGWS
jgi:hypothetical protein